MRAAFPPCSLLARQETAPSPCARWLACWRAQGPLCVLPSLLAPAVLLRRASSLARGNSAESLRSLAGGACGWLARSGPLQRRCRPPRSLGALCLLASCGPLCVLPSLLAPAVLLRRASSPVGESAPRPCARWLAPPAACWRCGPLRALPCLLVPSVLRRRASSPAGEAGPRPCARWPASSARRAVSARRSRRRRGPPVRPRGGILGRLDGCAAPGNAAGLIRWRRAQLVPFQPDGESAGPLAPGPLEGGVFLLVRAAAS